MEQNFLESNFLQTIIMTITVCVTAIIYWNNKRNAPQAAATILKLQIQDIEENIEKEDVYYVDKINIVFDTMKRIDKNGYKMIMIIFNQYFYEMYFELTIVDGLHLKEYEFK